MVEIREVGGLHHHYERRAAYRASDETPAPDRVPAEDSQLRVVLRRRRDLGTIGPAPLNKRAD